MLAPHTPTRFSVFLGQKISVLSLGRKAADGPRKEEGGGVGSVTPSKPSCAKDNKTYHLGELATLPKVVAEARSCKCRMILKECTGWWGVNKRSGWFRGNGKKVAKAISPATVFWAVRLAWALGWSRDVLRIPKHHGAAVRGGIQKSQRLGLGSHHVYIRVS
jgi:hypothetical protein